MSIATRIEAIEQHLTDDYSVLELAGADLTNVDKNIINLKESWEERLLYFLANGTDVVWNNWLPKINGSGETITLNNTIEAKIDFIYKGNTSQITTEESTNLFPLDKSQFPITSAGGSLTGSLNNDGTIQITGTKTTTSWENLNLPRQFNPVFLQGKTYTIASGLTLGIYTEGGTFVGNKGGKITPTENWVAKSSYWTTNQAKTFNQKLYPMVAEGVITINDSTWEEYGEGTPNPNHPQNVETVSGNNTITISNSDNTQSKSYPINLGTIELCKIEEYQDYIYKDNGKWYKYSAIGKSILDENTVLTYNNVAGQFYLLNQTIFPDYKLGTFMYNNYLLYSSASGWTGNENKFGMSSNNFWMYMKDGATSLSALQTWLSTHNMLIYYILNTPTTTEITDSTLIYQLEAIKKSYNNQTNISQTNASKPFVLDATALGSN